MTSPAPMIRLLVIDDDPLLLELLQHTLPAQGFEVTSEPSASSALARLGASENSFEVILTDLRMPASGGLDLAPKLRVLEKRPALIGMSATSPSPAELQAFDAFIVKPFTPTELRSVVQAVIDDRGFWPRSAQDGSPARSDSGSLPKTGHPHSPRAEACERPDEKLPVQLSNPVLDEQIFAQLRATLGLERLRQLYEMTANDVDSRLSRMRVSLAVSDLVELRTQAHAMKGSCAMVGAKQLSGLADEVELGSETDVDQLNAIEQACIRLRQVVTIVPP